MNPKMPLCLRHTTNNRDMMNLNFTVHLYTDLSRLKNKLRQIFETNYEEENNRENVFKKCDTKYIF